MRETIIKEIKTALQNNQYVFALWLEGADALGKVDKYSDIDFVADVLDNFEYKIFKLIEDTLSKIGKLDINEEVYVDHDKIYQKIYHLENTSEYLQIDFNIQSHSRKKEESTFVNGDIFEYAKLLFDKNNVVTFKEEDYVVDKEYIIRKVNEFRIRYTQHSRVIKYCEREQFLEAKMYYNKYVADPLLELARLIYTPKYFYLYMLHISDHMPKNVIEELESFYKVSNTRDIKENTFRSKEVFERYVSVINDKYELVEVLDGKI
ncbi:hypothetical protein RJG79_02870 [Mycoplasmatota bacterium WC44]